MTKFVISGYYGFGNFGDEAILTVLQEKLRAIGAEFTVLPPKTLNFAPIARADVLISGGGSLLQDATSLKSLLYYSFVILTALLLHKKVIIFAQGIGPLNSPISQFIVRNLLKHCAPVSVRDEKSLELLENWGIKARLVCDPFYALETPVPAKNGAVGVQLRGVKTMNDEFLHRLAEAVIKHFPGRQVEVYSLQDSIDLGVCTKFAALVPDAPVVHSLSVSEAIERISRLDFMLAMRFHAILAALKSGAKTLAINYDIKVQTLAAEYNLPVIELDGQNFDDQFSRLKTQEPKQICEVFDRSIFSDILGL